MSLFEEAVMSGTLSCSAETHLRFMINSLVKILAQCAVVIQ